MSKLKPTPGHVVALDKLPACDLCGQTAHWDAPTVHGPWGYLCDTCNQQFARYPGQTGVGIGQRLIVRAQ